MTKLTAIIFGLLLTVCSAAAQQPLPGFADLAEKWLPSVVNIST